MRVKVVVGEGRRLTYDEHGHTAEHGEEIEIPTEAAQFLIGRGQVKPTEVEVPKPKPQPQPKPQPPKPPQPPPVAARKKRPW
jgi:hypothetical protein